MKKEKMYYIKTSGFLGNAFLWWAKNSKGYTSDIRKAERYTYSEAVKSATRDYDEIFECDYIDNLLESHKLIIDSQYVDRSKIVPKDFTLAK